VRALALFVAQTLAVVSILASLLVLAGRHPLRLDLSPDRSLTLSPHTLRVLGELHGEVHATAFTASQEQAIRQQIADLLRLYGDAQPLVTARMLDLDRSPGEAERLGVSNYNVVILESDGRRERIDPVTEENLTAGLLAVTGRSTVVAYVVQGHGEPDLRDINERSGSGDAAAALASDGFDVRPLPGAGRIPPDAGLVILAGPTHELQPAEVDALDGYLRGGGRLLVLVDTDAPRSVLDLLGRFGVEAGKDIVVDQDAKLFGADGLSARVADLNEKFVSDRPTASALLPLAQSIRLEERPGMEAEFLAVTDETTWADVGGRPHGTERVFRAGTDRGGPLPVGAVVRVPAADREGRLVAVGDSRFASNSQLGVLGNRDLLLVAAEVAARRDQAIAAPRRRPTSTGPFSTLALTAREARTIFWVACVLPAMLLGTAAVGVALSRSRTA